jgi:predicted MPP superfamily phosphohydrolase
VRIVDLDGRAGSTPRHGLRARLLARVPGNQLCRLHLTQAALAMPGLDDRLAGLSISHWSDLHFCGRIDREYFREVVALANVSPPDILALTGDVCESLRYLDWVVELLSVAQARLGKYFVLGNHDLRTRDVPRLRAALEHAGFTDLGGRAALVDQGRVVLAGDERPWFAGEPQLPGGLPTRPQPLKVLLAHTPDRLSWARARGFDLMLAGHTHGGQIRLPWIGPVLCPSRHGTKYASGFYHLPPTLLHVSRGTGSLFPLRLFCPPEITTLVLNRCGRRADQPQRQ